jgi:dipeptidyl-peptidase-4
LHQGLDRRKTVRFSRRFAARALSFSLVALSLAATALAQHPPIPRVVGSPSTSGVSIQEVCAAAVPREAQGNEFQWSPDGASIAYFKPIGAGFGLRLELDAVNASGSERTVLLSGPQIDRLFPPTSATEGADRIPPPRDMTGFEWSSDGSGILLHSDVSIVWLDRKTLQTRTLVGGEAQAGKRVTDVQLSPDGRWASFIRDHNLWLVGIGGGHERPITQGGTATLRKAELDWLYPNELGLKHGYAWSPDSSKIAYLTFDLKSVATYTPPFQSEDEEESSTTIDYPTAGKKNPSVRIFVTGIQEKSASLAIDTGSDKEAYLPRLQWLPDSKHLALQRLNRPQTQLDLLIADAHTGASRVLLSDKDSYWINLSNILYFFKNTPQLIWSSERSGFRHLYLYDLNGKLVKQLTNGKWEVTALDAVDERQKRLYFTSTEKTPLERHVYVTSLDGAPAQRISGESGTHEATFNSNATAFIDNFSTAVKPWARTVYRVNEGVSLASPATANSQPAQQAESRPVVTRLFPLDESSPKASTLQPVNFLTVKTHDGIELNAMMIRPAPFAADKKYPAIVYVEGRPGSQVVHDAWDGDVSMWQQLLVQNGYVVFAVDNRGTTGRGHEFEEYIHLRFEGQEMTDQKDAVHFLQSLPYIDPARVGIWGRGFGGALVVNAMLHPPLLFKAGFAIAPVVNWQRYDSAFTERYLGDPIKNQDGYLTSSPLDEWQRYKGPMLVAQGTDDLQVHPDQSMELQEDLVEKRKYVEIALYPGAGHIIDKPNACTVLYQRATDFFGKTLVSSP